MRVGLKETALSSTKLIDKKIFTILNSNFYLNNELQ